MPYNNDLLNFHKYSNMLMVLKIECNYHFLFFSLYLEVKYEARFSQSAENDKKITFFPSLFLCSHHEVTCEVCLTSAVMIVS